MKNLNLNFIPSQTQISQFYSSFQSLSPPPSPLPSQPSNPTQQSLLPPPRTLTSTQLHSLLHRLTPNPSQQAITQQIKKIHQLNLLHLSHQQTSSRPPNNHSIQNRLLLQGKKRQQRLELLRKIQQKQEIQGLQEKPVITDRYLYDYKPLKDRVGEIIGKREEKVRVMEEEGRPGFNPKIDKYSAFIAQVRREGESEGEFVERLHRNERVEERRRVVCERVEEEMRKEATFQPKINENSRKIYNQITSNKQNKENNKTLPNKSPPEPPLFQPEICKKSSQIVRKLSGSVGATWRERLDEDCQKRKVKEREMERRREEEYSFQPKINGNSKKMVDRRKSYDLRGDQTTKENSVDRGENNAEITKDEESKGVTRRQWSSIQKPRSIAQTPSDRNDISQRNQAKLQQLFGKKKFIIY